MIAYFKKHLFAKIGILFFFASISIIVSSYYISIYWVNLQKDDLMDAHDAYFQYKLIESWGSNLDFEIIASELNNLHMGAIVYKMDDDHNCENDGFPLWSNVEVALNSCDYYSHLDTEMLGERYNIQYDEWVSFGEMYLENRRLQTTYVEFPPFKYYLISSYVEPWTASTLAPPLVLVLVLMGLLFVVVRRFLNPINLIEKRIKTLEKGDLTSEIQVVGSDELSILTANFNKLILDVGDLLKQKERLLSDVSHELRTPLAKIRLLTAMLPQHKKIAEIDKQIHSLDSMITNILLSDKMASAYSNLNLKSTTIKKLVDSALDLTFVKDLQLEINHNATLAVDSVKCAIAIKNLIENAYKYSPKGSKITLSTSHDDDFLSINIIDEGPGIPEDQLTKIIKAFVRMPNSKRSGFGLGLSICNKVMNAHGGHLKINNNKGGGATFSLLFPLK